MNKYCVRYSNKYKRTALFLVQDLTPERKSLRNHRIKLTYKNDITVVNMSTIEYKDIVNIKLKIILKYICTPAYRRTKFRKVLRRYICWFYPEELL